MPVFWSVSNDLAQAQEKYRQGTMSDKQFLLAFSEGVRQNNGAVRDSLEEIYERIQRLHQKIDRVEAKLGSARKPG